MQIFSRSLHCRLSNYCDYNYTRAWRVGLFFVCSSLISLLVQTLSIIRRCYTVHLQWVTSDFQSLLGVLYYPVEIFSSAWWSWGVLSSHLFILSIWLVLLVQSPDHPDGYSPVKFKYSWDNCLIKEKLIVECWEMFVVPLTFLTYLAYCGEVLQDVWLGCAVKSNEDGRVLASATWDDCVCLGLIVDWKLLACSSVTTVWTTTAVLFRNKTGSLLNWNLLSSCSGP